MRTISRFLTRNIGDCWFLSALSSLAQSLPEDCPLKVKQTAVERVIQREANSTEEAKNAGVYRVVGNKVDFLSGKYLISGR